MARRSTPHTTGSHDVIDMYYSKCDEAFVEKYWAEEWEHAMYHFERSHLFDDEDLSDCTDILLQNEQIEEAIVSDEVDNQYQQDEDVLRENYDHSSILDTNAKIRLIVDESV